jgi:hypothetical protein
VSRNPKSYREKLAPIFFEVASLNREFETRFAEIQRECERKLASLGPSATEQQRSEVGILYRAKVTYLDGYIAFKLQEVHKRYGHSIAFNELSYSYFDFSNHADTDEGNLQRLFEYMHWERHGESLRKTSQAVDGGDIPALRRLHRTDEDRLRVFAGKGPIKKYQGDAVHRQFLELVLCFEVSALTEEERADCADDFCACGKSHDPDALGKQFRRLKKQLQTSASPETPQL